VKTFENNGSSSTSFTNFFAMQRQDLPLQSNRRYASTIIIVHDVPNDVRFLLPVLNAQHLE